MGKTTASDRPRIGRAVQALLLRSSEEKWLRQLFRSTGESGWCFDAVGFRVAARMCYDVPGMQNWYTKT